MRAIAFIVGIFFAMSVAWALHIPGAAPQPAATRPASGPAAGKTVGQVGPWRVEVIGVKLDFAEVKTMPTTQGAATQPGAEGMTSDDKLLIVTLQITNTGKAAAEYDTLRESSGLALSNKQSLPPARFKDLYPAAGVAQSVSVPPGQSVTDVLVFVPTEAMVSAAADQPQEGDAKHPFSLSLSGIKAGAGGTVTLSFSYSDVKGND